MDKRIRRTRRILGQSLIHLLDQHPFHQITIREITETAGVAYSTFFRNFESIDELLLEYTSDLLRTLRYEIAQTKSHSDYDLWQQQARTFFTHVQAHRQLYRIMLRTPITQTMLKSFQQELVADNLSTLLQKNVQFTDANSPPVDLVIHNAITQLFGMIEWWLDQDMQVDIDTMVDYYNTLILFPTYHLLLSGKKHQ